MPVNKKWKTVSSHLCELGEGPLWDESSNSIWWVDILSCKIHEYNLKRQTLHAIDTPSFVGSFAFRSNGGIIAATREGFVAIDSSNNLNVVSNPEEHLPDNRFNDGKCDPAGRFFAGSMSMSEQPKKGNLYALETDFRVSHKLADISCSNGLAWSHDEKTFYYIDTPTQAVVAFDYHKESGAIENGRVVISVPKEEGSPDGMTIDEEGMLWIAFWNGWQVARWDPGSGRKLESIPLPVSLVTSCTFGGDSYQDLFITSARTGLSDEQLLQQPLAGSLFVVEKCGHRGRRPFYLKVS